MVRKENIFPFTIDVRIAAAFGGLAKRLVVDWRLCEYWGQRLELHCACVGQEVGGVSFAAQRHCVGRKPD